MRTYVSHLKISKTPIGDKNEFLKNISKNYIKMKKKFIQFFKDRVLAKKRPCGKPEGKKESLKVFEKHKQGQYEKGSRKKTWSWMVSLYRPCQDPIGQGHGEWNGNRPLLYPSLSAMPRAHPAWPK